MKKLNKITLILFSLSTTSCMTDKEFHQSLIDDLHQKKGYEALSDEELDAIVGSKYYYSIHDIPDYSNYIGNIQNMETIMRDINFQIYHRGWVDLR